MKADNFEIPKYAQLQDMDHRRTVVSCEVPNIGEVYCNGIVCALGIYGHRLGLSRWTNPIRRLVVSFYRSQHFVTYLPSRCCGRSYPGGRVGRDRCIHAQVTAECQGRPADENSDGCLGGARR